ncbi:MAG TPA: TonB-dependent receptor [Candidatus Didemnitutus sp.]|nr:TonB-dependent receptor [Candidatus Didemnitutus sp.]
MLPSSCAFRRSLVRAALGVIALAATSLPAQELPAPDATPASALRGLTVEQLLQVEVTSASRQAEPWSDASSNVFLIRGASAWSTGATTLPDLLRLAPNLFVAQSNSWQWAVNARGFVRSDSFSNKMLVMIDGRTVYSPLFSNVFWDSTSTFLPDLDRIEVISGPAGTTFGANAVNGVINIESKSAFDTLGGLLTGGVGTDQSNLGVRYGARVGDSGAVRVYAQMEDADPSRTESGAKDDFDAWHTRQAGFRTDWGNASTGALLVEGDYFSGAFNNAPLPATTSEDGNVLVKWTRDLTSDSSLWVRAYYDYSMRDNESVLTEITRTTDFEFQHTIRFGPAQELIWGANYRAMQDSMQTVGFAILPASLDFALGSVFAQHQLKFAHDLFQLTSGLRMEHNYFSGWEYEPNLRLSWRPNDQTFWIAGSRATRIPSRLETGFFEPATPPYIVVGGDDVVAEVVDAYELGWRSRPATNLSVTTTAYVQNYDHLRSVQPTSPATFGNDVKGRSYGVEVFLDWQATSWWRIRVGGFGMNESTWIRPGGADIEQARGERSFPSYQVQLRNTFHLSRSLTFWSDLRRVGAVPPGDAAGVELPAYTELDATLTWAVQPGLDVALTGRNLLHPSHFEIGDLSTRRAVPRTVEVSLRQKF